MRNLWKNLWRRKWRILESLLLVLVIPSAFIFFSTVQSIVPHTEISSLPEISEKNAPQIAIVFGAAAWGDRPSHVFEDRLQVAADLYHAHKIQKILVSGDNGHEDYNEPQAGKKFLLSQDIPEEDIVLDYAGFRTYDTCVRAKKIFGINDAYLVTQGFHLPRAVFLCEQFGIHSQGVSATLRPYRGDIKNYIRETLAQQKAFYETYIFRHDPKFLGKEEHIFEK